MDGVEKYGLVRGGLQDHVDQQRTLLLCYTSTVECGYNLHRDFLACVALLDTEYTCTPWGLFQMMGRDRPVPPPSPPLGG
jgi:hypothetical protein